MLHMYICVLDICIREHTILKVRVSESTFIVWVFLVQHLVHSRAQFHMKLFNHAQGQSSS